MAKKTRRVSRKRAKKLVVGSNEYKKLLGNLAKAHGVTFGEMQIRVNGVAKNAIEKGKTNSKMKWHFTPPLSVCQVADFLNVHRDKIGDEFRLVYRYGTTFIVVFYFYYKDLL